MKHTKGPWLQNTVLNEVGKPIPKVFGKNSSTFILVDGENKEANAHLIAAAPELLKTLKYLSKLNLGDALVERIEKVIAKAQGGGK